MVRLITLLFLSSAGCSGDDPGASATEEPAETDTETGTETDTEVGAETETAALTPESVCAVGLGVLEACSYTGTTEVDCAEALAGCTQDDLASLLGFYECFAATCDPYSCVAYIANLGPGCTGADSGDTDGG